MEDGLYHVDIGFPADLKLPRGQLALEYSFHARRAAETDRISPYCSLPGLLDLSAGIVEVEVKHGKLIKVVTRQPYSEQVDIVLVVMLTTGRVKTVWFNRTNDKHRTLDRSRYAIP